MNSPLFNKTYRHLFIAQVIALLGAGLSTVALVLLADKLAGDQAGIVLGIAFAVKMIAYVGISPIVGSIVHLLPRRKFLVGLDIARACCVVTIPLVTEIWQIYILIFLLNSFSAGFTPTFQAIIPDILPDAGSYTRAVSLSRLAYDLEALLSPALAALALLFVSYNALFIMNAFAFIISALMVLSVSLPKLVTSTTKAKPQLSRGVRLYLATPQLRGLLALIVAVALSSALIIVNSVVYIRQLFGGSESETAITLAAYGAGSMLTALALPSLLAKFSHRFFMFAGGLLQVVGFVVGAIMFNFEFLLVIWFVLGIGTSLVQTPAGILLKNSVEQIDRSPIYSAHFALSHLCWLVTYPLAGWLGKSFSVTTTFLIFATLTLITTVLATRLWPANSKSNQV